MSDDVEMVWRISIPSQAGKEKRKQRGEHKYDGDYEMPNHSKIAAYHADRDCHHISDVPDSLTWYMKREKAERHGLDPCGNCVTGEEGGHFEGATCPACGEDIDVQIPTHLQEDCEAL